MATLAERCLSRYYGHVPHPYRLFERRVDTLISERTRVMLDAGCGRSVPVLRNYIGKVPRLIGVEMVEFADVPVGIEAVRSNLAALPLREASVDLIMSRSVFEHLNDPGAVYREFARVLCPGGCVVFMTANMWDYGTLAARLIPNRFHARIVHALEGRQEEDTFPTAYKTNTRRDVDRLASEAGLHVESFEYLSQYPNYLMFNGVAFFIGTCFEKTISRFDTLRWLRGWILVTLRKPDRRT